MEQRHRGYGFRAAVRSAAAAVSGALVLACLVVVGSAPANAAFHWTNPVDLSREAKGVGAVRLAGSADASRLAAVFLGEKSLTDDSVRVTTSSDGGATWSAPKTLGEGNQQAVAMSKDGRRITAVWVDFVGDNSFVRESASEDFGRTWTASQPVSVDDFNVGNPRLATSDDGTRITIVWSDTKAGAWPQYSRVRAVSSSNTGRTWTAPKELTGPDDHGDTYQGDWPDVTASSDGRTLTAVWGSSNSYAMESNVSTDGGGTWTTPKRVSFDGSPVGGIRVASSDNGQAVTVVYDARLGSTERVYAAQKATVTGAWGTSSLVGKGTTPRIAGNADGSAWSMVWAGLDDDLGMRATRQTSSIWWRDDKKTLDLAPASDPDLAASPDLRRLVAAWLNGDNKLMVSTSNDSGAKWDKPVQIAGSRAAAPQLVASNGRRQVVAWPHDGDVAQASTGWFKDTQKITFPAVADRQFSAGALALKATASSRLPVSYRSDTPKVCTTRGNLVVPKSAGRCAVTAIQAGGRDYEPAASVQRSFTVIRSNQSISFPSLRNAFLGAKPVQLRAAATSRLAVSYRVESPYVCSLQGTRVRLRSPGLCVVTALQSGSSGYHAATQVQRAFRVSVKAPATPDNAAYMVRSAQRTLVTWQPGRRGGAVLNFAVLVNGNVACRVPGSATSCELSDAYGARASIKVVATNEAGRSPAKVAREKTRDDWTAIGKVKFRARKAALGKGDRAWLAGKAQQLVQHGFTRVRVTGQTSQAESRIGVRFRNKLAAKRARATARVLAAQFGALHAKVQVDRDARAGKEPQGRQAVLWIR